MLRALKVFEACVIKQKDELIELPDDVPTIHNAVRREQNK